MVEPKEMNSAVRYIGRGKITALSCSGLPRAPVTTPRFRSDALRSPLQPSQFPVYTIQHNGRFLAFVSSSGCVWTFAAALKHRRFMPCVRHEALGHSPKPVKPVIIRWLSKYLDSQRFSQHQMVEGKIQSPVLTMRSGRITAAEAASIGKALGDPSRMSLYTYIASNKERFCGQICKYQALSGATISHHLRILQQAGLIASKRDGQFIYYRAIPERLKSYCAYLSTLRRSSKAVSSSIKR